MNALLDRTARPFVSFPFVPSRFGSVPTFKACALAGLATSALWLLGLAPAFGLDRGPMAAALGGVVLGLAVALALTEVNNYRMQIAVLAGAALGVRAAGAPVLPYLDLVAVALGLSMVIGRFGCFSAGCCHGRPWSVGVRYGERHRQVGFPGHLVGARLLPVPLIEASYVLMVSAAALAAIVRSAPPGAALVVVVLGYAVGRFGFELLRGDAGRPYRYGLSEAQRTSVAVSIAAVIAGAAGVVPSHEAVTAIAGVLCVAAAVLVSRELRGLPLPARLRRARAIREVAQLIDALSTGRFAPGQPTGSAASGVPAEDPDRSSRIPVAHTSFGLRISAELLETDGGTVYHYACSRDDGEITSSSALALSRLVRDLRHPAGTVERIGEGPVVHLLVRSGPPTEAGRRAADGGRSVTSP